MNVSEDLFEIFKKSSGINEDIDITHWYLDLCEILHLEVQKNQLKTDALNLCMLFVYKQVGTISLRTLYDPDPVYRSWEFKCLWRRYHFLLEKVSSVIIS